MFVGLSVSRRVIGTGEREVSFGCVWGDVTGMTANTSKALGALARPEWDILAPPSLR